MKRRRLYKSGFCADVRHMRPCIGEFKNGARVGNATTLCSCECHGDYEDRMIAAGYREEEEVG